MVAVLNSVLVKLFTSAPEPAIRWELKRYELGMTVYVTYDGGRHT